MNMTHEQQPDVALAAPGQRPNVLIVEDEPALARLYRAYLADEQIDLEHVDTGKAALERLERSPPAAILLDLKLPDMDGRTVLDHVIRAGLPTSVLVITAPCHGAAEDRARPLHLLEKEAIEAAIARCDGNIFQAARLLEINPSTIYRKKAGWNPNA